MRTVKDLIMSGDEPLFPVRIVYSSPMSAEELRDVEDVVAIWLRQLRRETERAAAIVDGESRK